MSNFLTRIVLILLLLLVAQQAFAGGYAGGLDVRRVYVDHLGKVHFGTSSQPANTCSNWGEYWIFDSNTKGGKQMLSVLLSAKLTYRKIDVWYEISSMPGTNQYTGCSDDAMARAVMISIN